MTKLLAQERFWLHVDRSAGPDGCWPWTGNKDKDGYGWFNPGMGSPVRAHRYVMGDAANGANVLHKCDNPPCCNRRHLFIGSHLDNMRDKATKGRAPSLPGEANGRSKITAAQVLEIRASKETGPVLGRRYGLHHSTIYDIQHGKRWRHIAV